MPVSRAVKQLILDAENIGFRMEWSKEGGHLYYCNGVGPLPGATSITALYEATSGSDGLINWAANTVLTKALEIIGLGGAPEYARTEAWAAKNEASSRGSAVHSVVEAMNKGGEPKFSTSAAAYKDVAQAYAVQYGAWAIQNRVDVIAAEQMVANLTLQYGGSFDLLAKIDGKLTLVDVKTGKPRTSYRLQLAGYSMCEYRGDEGMVPEEMPEVDQVMALYLSPDGFDPKPYPVTDADRALFRRLVEQYHENRAYQEAA